MKFFFALFMSAVAYTLLSTGFVLQKKGINWIGKNPGSDKEFYKNLITWLSGFRLMNIYGVPGAIALKSLQPYVVGSFAGWGIVVLVFLSYIILKENLYKSDYYYSALIIFGIILLFLFQGSESKEVETDKLIAVLYFSVPLVLLFSGFVGKSGKKIKSVVFAIASGVSAGIMVVSLKFLVGFFGYRVGGYFGSVYLYLYISAALLSFISLQFALKNGSMILIGQLQYSANILYPVLGSALLLKNRISFITLFAILLIVFSVIKILKKH